MSNYLTIAVISAAIQEIVQAAVIVVPGANVRVGPPRPVLPGHTEVNIYLYRLSPNPYNRGNDLPTRSADGTLIKVPQAAVDLHYVISFTGEDHLATEKMLGRVVAVLHAMPTLTDEELGRIVREGGPFPFLAESDLPALGGSVTLTPEYLSLEELSKLWTVFFQLAHRPSLQYVVSPVLIDADLVPVPARRPHEVDTAVQAGGDREVVRYVDKKLKAGGD